MPDKGFTATFISNSGKTLRQYNITGWKLYLARVLLGVVVLLLSAAVFAVAYGIINAGETSRMRQEISRLQDSLARRSTLESRVQALENHLQYLDGYRKKLENIAGLVTVQEDSLE